MQYLGVIKSFGEVATPSSGGKNTLHGIINSRQGSSEMESARNVQVKDKEVRGLRFTSAPSDRPNVINRGVFF